MESQQEINNKCIVILKFFNNYYVHSLSRHEQFSNFINNNLLEILNSSFKFSNKNDYLINTNGKNLGIYWSVDKELDVNKDKINEIEQIIGCNNKENDSKKLINNIDHIDNIEKQIINIEIIPQLKGGSLIDVVKAIGSIGELFVFAYKGIIYIIEVFLWSIEVIIWILKELADPGKLISEFGSTMTTLMFALVYAPMQILYNIMKKSVNLLDRTVFNGFWGWDTRPASINDEEKAAYFSNNNKCNGKKCYLKKDGKVPFNVIIGTIICPPLGVFMEYGLTGWINILICVLLSLCLYFPGLVYALMCIYC